MAPRVDPVASDEALPARADVVVIGGGIIGTSAALFLAQKGISVVAVREGPHRRRAIEPQLGLVPQDGARPARNPAGHREPAPVGADERDGRGRDRLPHLRDHVSGRDRGRSGAARRMARTRPRIPARHADHRRRRGGGAAAGARQEMGRRALHRERRQGRAATGGARDRQRRAAAWRQHPHQLRGARDRDRRPGGSPPWLPRRAGSPASRRCSPAAPGRGCSAAISESSCRN